MRPRERLLAVFHGEYESSVDEKGRVNLPAKLRDEIGEKWEGAEFHATFSPDGCIELCVPEEWDRRVEALRAAPFARKKSRRFQRTMSAQTERTALDKQGHFGLKVMQARAERIGGTLDIQSSPGRGTAVTVCWPVQV